MFVGHYGPAFAATAARKSIPLWVAFIAVQLVDVLWGVFVLFGIEKVRIVPGFTATNPLDLYYMPYTHGLIAAIFWAIAGGVFYSFRKIGGWSAAMAISAAVFSHWVLDWLVHVPDLPLYDNSFKVGLGLWNHPALAFILEFAILSGGMYLYLKSTEPVSRLGRYGMVVFCCVMLVVQAIVFFGPPPHSGKMAAISALIFYFVFGAVAYWQERLRVPRSHIPSNI